MKKPYFIVVDGGDGSGKDTQALMIAKYYIEKGHDKIRMRSHPSLDNAAGLKAKRALESGGTKGHILGAVFYIIDVLRSLIKYYRFDSDVIIFVRYLLGTCYLPRSFVEIGYNFFSFILPNSSFMFYIDVSAEVAHERIRKRGETEEMFESLEQLNKMRKKMLFITKKKKWHIINGNGSINEIWTTIKRKLPA